MIDAVGVRPDHDRMAVTTVKSTYLQDVESVRALEALARRMEGSEIRGVAARHSNRSDGRRNRWLCKTCRSRSIAGFRSRAQGGYCAVGTGFAHGAPRSRPEVTLRPRMIHLDTSFLIRALELGSPESRRLRRWIRTGETLVLSTVAWAEFRCGPLSDSDLESAAGLVDHYRQFAADHATIAARLCNESGIKCGSLTDCMIAATALSDDAAVATANAPDFGRFREIGLSIA